MKKYVTPELNITKFASENILTVSTEDLQANKLTVATENGSAVTFENGSLDFVQ